MHLGQVGTACDRCHTVDAAQFAADPLLSRRGAFPLAGKHVTTPCAKCHPRETAAFPAGAGTAARLHPVSRDCAACHKDPHLGQTDGACARCHAADSFRVSAFKHTGLDYMFSMGGHARLPCDKCHKRETGAFPGGQGTAIRLRIPRTCVGCHP